MKKLKSTVAGESLQTERMSNGKRKLLRTLELKICHQLFSIEKGFVTDYSSIPWFGRFVVHWSKVDIAGVIHDWLYKYGKVDGREISRSYADWIWRKTALSGSHHANGVQAWICWFSLRVGGCCAWRKYRKFNRFDSKQQDIEN